MLYHKNEKTPKCRHLRVHIILYRLDQMTETVLADINWWSKPAVRLQVFLLGGVGMQSSELASYFGDVGIIGAGAVGTGLAYALRRAGLGPAAVASRTNARARELIEGLKAGIACSPAELVERCRTVFLTVPDDQILLLSQALPWRKGHIAIHCSGAHSLEVLKPVAEAGGRRGAFHPLNSFPSRKLSRSRLGHSFFGIESDEESLLEALDTLAQTLGRGALHVAGDRRVLYHICGVLASNYLVALLDAAGGLFSSLGYSEEEGLRALSPLVQATWENIGRVGTKAALSGPIARGDGGTVRAHLEYLTQLGEADLLKLYVTLGELTLEVAKAKGTLTGDNYQRLKEIFAQQEG